MKRLRQNEPVSTSVTQRLTAARRENNRLIEHRKNAYHERNLILSVITRLWPAHLMPVRKGQTTQNDWAWVLCIHSPEGQLAWHLPNVEMDAYFGHLERLTENHWDGHRATDKLSRLEDMAHGESSAARAVAAKALGRALPSTACIHHVNGNHFDNSRSNLVICEDAEYHRFLHQRSRELRQMRELAEYLHDNPNELA